MAEKQARAMHNMAVTQRLIMLDEPNKDGASLPCNNLPVAKNRAFFGREDILGKIEEQLRPADTNRPLSSLAIHGLGGTGKTQIALAYAYQKRDEVDAVLWIAAHDSMSIEQDFGRVAVNTLKLPGAHHGPQANRENMVLVLNWLHSTCKTTRVDDYNGTREQG